MNRKQQFLNAVQILAPNDPFIYQVALHVPEEALPVCPGGAALEFVGTILRLREPVSGPAVKPPVAQKPSCRRVARGKRSLPTSQAVRVKSAEFWLKLGEADQALRELEALPGSHWNHPAAIKTRVAALGALREQNEITLQA